MTSDAMDRLKLYTFLIELRKELVKQGLTLNFSLKDVLTLLRMNEVEAIAHFCFKLLREGEAKKIIEAIKRVSEAYL